MPWFRHHFHCEACAGGWLAEAENVDAADCPFCGARDAFPYKSDDLAIVVEWTGEAFVVFECVDCDQPPDYRERGRFTSREAAQAFLAAPRGKAA